MKLERPSIQDDGQGLTDGLCIRRLAARFLCLSFHAGELADG